MRVQKNNKAFAYRVPIGDYDYLQCVSFHLTSASKQCLAFSILLVVSVPRFDHNGA